MLQKGKLHQQEGIQELKGKKQMENSIRQLLQSPPGEDMLTTCL